jgi:hypothetical protein
MYLFILINLLALALAGCFPEDEFFEEDAFIEEEPAPAVEAAPPPAVLSCELTSF